MKYLTIDDIKIEKPDFNSLNQPKGQIIVNWLIDWIKHSIEHGIADYGDFIPSKNDFAKFLNVSSATMQNSIRQVKNLGYFSSKQSIGTYIVDLNDIHSQDELCHTTIAECKIKKIVLDNKTKINDAIISIQELSKLTNISQNTIRFALINLSQKGYLEQIRSKGNKYCWIYKKEFILSKDEIENGLKDENVTLTHQLVEKIRTYIEKTYKTGDKILPNSAFCAMFDVSIKTINDAMKILNTKKIILSRRGRYGTVYLGKNQNSKSDFMGIERKNKIPQNKYIYSWQKALSHIKKYIIENYEAGDKIAPIRELATILNISPNTLRRALNELFKNGNLVSKRGKLGGIFIMEMPENEQDIYRWLAINPNVAFK